MGAAAEEKNKKTTMWLYCSALVQLLNAVFESFSVDVSLQADWVCG